MKTLTFADALNPSTVSPIDNENGNSENGDGNMSPSWERFWQEARGEMPIAIAERVDVNENDNTNNNNDTAFDTEISGNPVSGSKSKINIPDYENNQGIVETGEVTNVANGLDDDHDDNGRHGSSPQWDGCFYLEGILGGAMAFGVVLGVFITELIGAIVYLFGVGFHKLGKQQNMPIFFQAIFQLIAQAFMVVDAVCLLTSVLVSEIMGLVTAIIIFVICACNHDRHKRSYEWMMYIRKLAHLTRWSFRSFHHGWEPERKFPVGHEEESDAANGTNGNNVHPSNSIPGSGNSTQKFGGHGDEPTVIETSATFVIETLEEDPESAIGDEANKSAKAKQQSLSSLPPGSMQNSAAVSTYSSESSSSSASFVPPPPTASRRSVFDGPELGEASPPISFVMEDEMD